MTNAQAKILLCALVHDGMDHRKLSEKARQEIIAAFDLILAMTKGDRE